MRTSAILTWFGVLVAVLSLGAGAADSVLIQPPPVQVRDGGAAPDGVASRATQWDAGDPTAEEQNVLEVINRARANPTAEGTRLGIDIKEGLTATQMSQVGPRPPLAMNKILLGTARVHSQDMWQNNYFDHPDLQGKTPDQ